MGKVPTIICLIVATSLLIIVVVFNLIKIWEFILRHRVTISIAILAVGVVGFNEIASPRLKKGQARHKDKPPLYLVIQSLPSGRPTLFTRPEQKKNYAFTLSSDHKMDSYIPEISITIGFPEIVSEITMNQFKSVHRGDVDVRKFSRISGEWGSQKIEYYMLVINIKDFTGGSQVSGYVSVDPIPKVKISGVITNL